MQNLAVVKTDELLLSLAADLPDAQSDGCDRAEEGPGILPPRLVAFAADKETGNMYWLSDECTIYGVHPGTNQPFWEQSLVEDGSLPAPEPIAALDFLPDHEALLVAMASGPLLLAAPSRGRPELVGALEGGVAAVAWSPGGELAAIVTGTARLLLMTSEWEVLAEVELNQSTERGATSQVRSPSARQLSRPHADMWAAARGLVGG